MNGKELIDALATKTGSTKADADRNIAALIHIITARRATTSLWSVSALSKSANALHALVATRLQAQNLRSRLPRLQLSRPGQH